MKILKKWAFPSCSDNEFPAKSDNGYDKTIPQRVLNRASGGGIDFINRRRLCFNKNHVDIMILAKKWGKKIESFFISPKIILF